METTSTLKFAQRAKSIHTSAKVNELLDDKAVIRKLKRELEELKKQLEERTVQVSEGAVLTSNSNSLELSIMHSKVNELMQTIQNKELCLQQVTTEKLTIETQLMESQSRESNLQKSLSEIRTTIDALKGQFSNEQLLRQQSEQQCKELQQSLCLLQYVFLYDYYDCFMVHS